MPKLVTHTAIAIPVVSEIHKSSDFIQLLQKYDEMYPEGDIIRIICDNHSAHKSKEVQNYLATKAEGRFVFVFTPKHASWLNLIESFISKMTKQMLKGIRVESKQELKERIYQYFDEINANQSYTIGHISSMKFRRKKLHPIRLVNYYSMYYILSLYPHHTPFELCFLLYYIANSVFIAYN